MPYDKKLGRWRSMDEICDEAYQQAVEMGEVPPANRPNLRPLKSDVDAEQADWEGESDTCARLSQGRDCRLCHHSGCGNCPECHPEVPEWTLS